MRTLIAIRCSRRCMKWAVEWRSTRVARCLIPPLKKPRKKPASLCESPPNPGRRDLIDPPPGPGHELFYRMWGRLAYDPKAKPPHAIAPEEYRVASQIVVELRDALLADPDMYLWPEIHPASITAKTTEDPDDFVATLPEAVRDRLGNVASAKQTPVEIADALSAASADWRNRRCPIFNCWPSSPAITPIVCEPPTIWNCSTSSKIRRRSIKPPRN